MDFDRLEEKLKALVREELMKILKGKLLVIITGGTVGAKTALQQLESLAVQKNISIDLVFSRAASKIHDAKSLKERLKASKVFTEGRERAEIRDYKGVVFPVLTRNTASKAANLILDGYGAELMIDALMLGIPVIAAKDAADIESPGWSSLGFKMANESLKNAAGKNLAALEDFGVVLCSAENLGSAVENMLFGSSNAKAEKAGAENVKTAFEVKIDKKVVTRKDIAPYLEKGAKIILPKDAVITPLAGDIIRNNNLRITKE